MAALEFAAVFVSFANERSRFRPLMLWRTCGGCFESGLSAQPPSDIRGVREALA